MKQMRISTMLAAFVTGAAITSATAAPELVHRWSFNGNYNDSIGGTGASTIGSAIAFNDGNTAVVMSGAGNSTGSLNLGVNMLPTDVPEVTVELWVTHNGVKNWSRLLDFGQNNQNYLTLTFCQGTDGNKERIEIKKANATLFATDNSLTPYAIGTPYHVSVTFRAFSDGATEIRWMRRDVTKGAIEHAGSVIVPNWTIGGVTSPNFFIGHSQYTADHDANATYDEVRVWKGMLTDDQLTASVLAGPDALPGISSATVVDWTGAVDDDATNAGNWSPSAPDASTIARFSGNFAAQIPSGASFACAGILFDNASLTADCDWRGLSAKIEGGSLDLAGCKLYVSALDGKGTITSTDETEGELHIDVPSGASSVNEDVAISGAVKVFKEGEGAFTAKGRMTNTGVGKFVAGTLTITGNKFTVDGLDGSGTISAGASVLKNHDFQADTVADGVAVIMAPQGWLTTGTSYVLRNNRDMANSQANGSNWCFINNGSSISQTFYVPFATTCSIRFNVGTRNNSGTQWKSNGNVKIDGVEVVAWTGQSNLTATRYGQTSLSAGYHTISIACTSNSGMSVDNIDLSVGSILDVNVAAGETSENNNVALSGAGLQVWKTGGGLLVMNKENTGFGFGSRYSGSVCMVVKEGTVKKSTVEGRGSCGAQYSTIKVEDGGQFDLAGRTYWDYDYIIEGSGPDGTGAIVNNTSVSSPWNTNSNKAYMQRVALSGDAVIGGTQPWALLFWGFGAEPITLNGHTLTMSGTTIYSGNNYFNGSGRVVIAEGATYEAVNRSPTASDSDVVVNGTLAVHDQSLTPIKSLKFGTDGKFSNSWDSNPQFVVYEEYAPPLTIVGKAQNVQLGADGHLDTALDLSLFSEAFNGTSLTFYPGIALTVRLGSRTFTAEMTKLVSWTVKPDITDLIADGENLEGVSLGMTDDGLYAYKLGADRPATARWTGGGNPANLNDPANWNCINLYGDALANTVPMNYTTVIVDGTTTFSIPEGVTDLPWKNVQFGDGQPKATQWGRIFYGADRSAISGTDWYLNTPLGDYTAMGTGDLANLVDAAWQVSWLDWAHLRFDGWFYATAAQAGVWHIRQKFDDYFAFAIDGEWKLVNPTYTVIVESDCEVTEGWHRFTVICGDTYGGQGPSLPLDGVNVPMAVSINGGGEVAFSNANFQMGSGTTVIKLDGDCDWRALKKIDLVSGATIDLNGHVLKVAKVLCDDYIGASVINTAATAGELQIEVEAGETFTLDGITVKGDVKVVKTGAGTLVPLAQASLFTGGVVVEEGTLKCALAGPRYTIGSMNLLQNWNFDEGSVGNNSGDWSYGNGGNGFSLPGWTSSTMAKIGLAKANGTWVAKSRGIGKYALFMQTNNNTADASQDVVVTVPGTYYYRFIYAGRPSHIGATTELRLIHGGVSQTLASVTTSADTYSTCEGTVEITEPGTYTLQFFQLTTSADKANTIDEVVFACCNANAKRGTVTANEGAVIEMNGKSDFFHNIFVLNGGTLQNTTGTDVGSGTAQLKYMFLTANSTLNLQNHYGFIGNSYTRSILDLGGYTLTVNVNANGRLFYLYNTEVRNGVLDVIDGGWLETGNSGVIATDATIKCQAAMRANGAVDVRDYVAYRTSSKHNEGTADFKVYGTFTPMSDTFYGCQMQNGSTVDLSARTNVWNTTTAADTTAKGSTTVTFADNAVITIDFTAGRSALKEILDANDRYIVKWTAETAPAETVKFKASEALRSLGYRVVVESDGLKLEPNGFTIYAR